MGKKNEAFSFGKSLIFLSTNLPQRLLGQIGNAKDGYRL